MIEPAGNKVDLGRIIQGCRDPYLKTGREKDDPRSLMIDPPRNNHDPLDFSNKAAGKRVFLAATNVFRGATNVFPARFNAVRQRKYLDWRDPLNDCRHKKVGICRKNK